jgi:hypothetical protein
MKYRTKAELLAQLEDEQAAGDPSWQSAHDSDIYRLLEILSREIGPLLDNPGEFATPDDLPTVVRLHGRARRGRAA